MDINDYMASLYMSKHPKLNKAIDIGVSLIYTLAEVAVLRACAGSENFLVQAFGLAFTVRYIKWQAADLINQMKRPS